MSIPRSTFFKKRRAERTSSTIKCLMPRMTSLLYTGNTFSTGVSPNVTGNRYKATSIILLINQNIKV